MRKIVFVIMIIFLSSCKEKKSAVELVEEAPIEVAEEIAEYGEYDSERYYEENDETMIDSQNDAFISNSLTTGATPYAKFYGRNYDCPYAQCSGIKVTAPENSDVIVTIKRNNQNGKVIAHGYINAGDTYQFDIPNGTFQTFFYMGEGWNPNKTIKDGIVGGFAKENGISKDYPQEIDDAILSYVLQLRRSGNFQTQGSNFEEAF